MGQENKPDPRVDDLLGQVAAQSIQLETANEEIAQLKQRCDTAEGALQSKSEDLAKLERQRSDDAAESPSKLKEQIKALVAKCTALEKARNDAASPERVAAAVKDRVALQSKAQRVLGDDFRVDGLDDRSLMVTVIDRLYGAGRDQDADGKPRSDDYVRAMFDSACESHTAGAVALQRVQETVAMRNVQNQEAGQRLDAQSARQQMINRNRNAWSAQEETK